MLGRRGFLGAAVSVGLTALDGVSAGQESPVEKRKALKPVGPTPVKPRSLEPDPRVNRVLQPLLDRHNVPGLVGALLVGEKLTAIGAVGVRKLGTEAPITVNDRVHIGSCTKAMTATLIGLLVDEGKLSWSSTVREIFPERAKSLHPDFQGVTVIQLLNHRAGLPPNGNWWMLGRNKTTTEQRKVLLSEMMKSSPVTKPGSTYEYSNVGYAIAGLMAEQVTGKSWEMLMRTRLFEPLEMATAGFGIPGKPGSVVEPWGHHDVSGRIESIQEDNAPALGPAGTVHVSVPYWAKFAALHLQGARGKARLLKAETFRTMHTPPPGGDYAAGWSVAGRSWAGGTALNHSGSNLTWYASVWLAPSRNFAFLTATNQGGAAAAKVCDDAIGALIALADQTEGTRPRRKGGRG